MFQKPIRDTKIVWSVDARSLSNNIAIKASLNKKVNSIRVVYRPEYMEQLCSFISEVRSQQKSKSEAELPIIVDIATRIQAVVGPLDEPIVLNYGESVKVGSQEGVGDFSVISEDFKRIFTPDVKIIVGHGYAELLVKSVESDYAICEVTQGGEAYENMVIHAPETTKEPTPDTIAKEHLNKLLEVGADAFMIPGFNNPENIATLRSLVDEKYQPWFFIKVDHQATVKRLESLLDYVEGVVIARIDLALTRNASSIPMITKQIISLCREKAKVIVTASEMLSSMQRNPTPTRAEVSDIANAVLDGSDAVLLSEDVATGAYGAEAVSAMDATIIDAEKQPRAFDGWDSQMPELKDPAVDSISFAAYRTAERVGAKAIVCLTQGGNTAFRLASFRAPVPIIAVTFKDSVYRQLSLIRGVEAHLLKSDPSIDDILPVVTDMLVSESWLEGGDRIVFVSITLSSVGTENSNLFTIQTL